MTIEAAVKQMVNSEQFQEKVKDDANYRMFNLRYRNGQIGHTMALNMLKKFGYRIEVIPSKSISKHIKEKGTRFVGSPRL